MLKQQYRQLNALFMLSIVWIFQTRKYIMTVRKQKREVQAIIWPNSACR